MKQNISAIAEAGIFSAAWFVIAILALSWQKSHAQETSVAQSAPYSAQQDLRSGGVIEESYQYHRQAQPAAPAAAAAPYRWGFPVESYRWGWFGAARYYPTVFWHRGYTGDDCRYSYRCGY